MPTSFWENSNTVSMSRPNLTPFTLVSVLACVLGGRLGFTRRATGATLPIPAATAARAAISCSLSTLKANTSLSSPYRISASDLPTPAKKMVRPVPPAFSARYSSPPLVTSNPLPWSAISLQMPRFGFVLTE